MLCGKISSTWHKLARGCCNSTSHMGWLAPVKSGKNFPLLEFILSNAPRTVNGKSVPFCTIWEQSYSIQSLTSRSALQTLTSRLYVYLNTHLNLGLRVG